MISVTFKGLLGKKLGTNWDLEVSSVFEIFQAVEANTKNSSAIFSDLSKLVKHFMILVDGQVLPSYSVFAKNLISGNKVEIVPIVQGGGPFAIWFVIGLLLTVASFIIFKALSPNKPRDIKTSGSILGRIRNVTSRNIVVPIGYGRLRVGSAVVNTDIVPKPIRGAESSTALNYILLDEIAYVENTSKNYGVIFDYDHNPFITI